MKFRIIFEVKFNPYFSPEISVSMYFSSKVFFDLTVNYGIKWRFFGFYISALLSPPFPMGNRLIQV